MTRYPALDWLRLVFASMVVISHGLFLSGMVEPVSRWTGNYTTIGSLAVVGFFAVSGFVITQSIERSSSLRTFIWRRAIRLLPALIAVRLITEPFWPSFINTPLWSIKYEVIAYGFLAALVTLGWHKRVWLLASIASAMIVAHFLRQDPFRFIDPKHQDPVHLICFTMPFFLIGSIAYQLNPSWLTRLLAKGRALDHDFSYGVYIWHFVPMRLMVGSHPAAFWTVSIAGTAVAAAGSWFLIERPCLKLKNLALPASD